MSEKRRWVHYEKEIQDRISSEGDLTLSYTFVEFLLNALSDKILVINSRNRTTKIPIKDIVDCGISYDRFWCKLDSTADYAVYGAEFKYPEFSIEDMNTNGD